MPDFYEIDFRQVHTAKSGDAIAIRYQTGQHWWVHLVDGGYATTAPEISKFIRETYGTTRINNVVVTHPDKDHAEGLAPILEEFDVDALWMLRPWTYAAELLPAFHRYQSVEALVKRLREEYPYIYELEKIAERRRISMREPFQRAQIGAFTVLAPSRERYFQLVIQSEKTPQTAGLGILSGLMQGVTPLIRFIKAGWGSEKFSSEATSVENEMSVVQYALLCGEKIVLTGDAGRDGMTEAANYAPNAGLFLPSVHYFQVPHHGGRRNLSTELLNRWIGPALPQKLPEGQWNFTAMISSAKEDADHPRKAVLRALLHRGAFILTTEDQPIIVQKNSSRTFHAVQNIAYPDEQEED
jgi:beta-lactamase superfamily II metal-dependent hydrolase